MVRQQSPGQHGRRRGRDLMVDLRESPGDKRRSETRSKILSRAGPVHRTNSSNVRKVRGARSAVMNEVRLDHIVRAGAVPGEGRRVMLPRSILLVIDLRHRANSDSENAVSRRGNSSGLYLAASLREIQQRRRVIVPGTDDKRNLVFFLQIVELFGKRGKRIKRANGVRVKGKIPDPVRIGVLLKRRFQGAYPPSRDLRSASPEDRTHRTGCCPARRWWD
jgi:hypothetical protein